MNALFLENDASVPDRLPLSGGSSDVFLRFRNEVFLKMQATQFAGFCSEGWQVFDSLEAARIAAKEWVGRYPNQEYLIYDARQQLVKRVLNGQPRGDLQAVWQASQTKPWWKFWS
jgi:hypothetical protein